MDYRTPKTDPYYDAIGTWINSDECDSLLFSCLYAVGANHRFPVDQAFFLEESLNHSVWHRRPEACGDCSSTISRDMFMGLLVYCFHFRRKDILDALWDYGWKHWWKMGVENKAPTKVRFWKLELSLPNNRVWFTPGLIALLAQLRTALNGSVSKTWWNFLPQVYSTEPGYTSHLTLLHLYLQLRLFGRLTLREKAVIAKIREHSPNNALALALLGNPDGLAQWPRDRVPTTADWAEEWRTQRTDTDTNLFPDTVTAPPKSHSGGDYLFVKHVLSLTYSTL